LPADFREVEERLQAPGGNDRAGKDRGGGAGAAPPAAGEGPFPPTV
jgi:hypothetical protein